MIEGYMTTKEAALHIKRSESLIRKLCKKGIFKGAVMAGHTWLIPKDEIENYTPGVRGFAAMWAMIKAELARQERAKE